VVAGVPVIINRCLQYNEAEVRDHICQGDYVPEVRHQHVSFWPGEVITKADMPARAIIKEGLNPDRGQKTTPSKRTIARAAPGQDDTARQEM
jgi:hypothetical protein